MFCCQNLHLGVVFKVYCSLYFSGNVHLKLSKGVYMRYVSTYTILCRVSDSNFSSGIMGQFTCVHI